MDKEVTGRWAPLPPPPVITEVVPTSQKHGIIWSYTTSDPGPSWVEPTFDDSSWKKGPGGFGRGAGDAARHTTWKTDDIWIRRDFTLNNTDTADLKFLVWHDEDVEIYINGVLAGTASEYNTAYAPLEMNEAGRKALKPGKNQMSVHCHQTVGGQYIDVGIVKIADAVQAP